MIKNTHSIDVLHVIDCHVAMAQDLAAANPRSAAFKTEVVEAGAAKIVIEDLISAAKYVLSNGNLDSRRDLERAIANAEG